MCNEASSLPLAITLLVNTARQLTCARRSGRRRRRRCGNQLSSLRTVLCDRPQMFSSANNSTRARAVCAIFSHPFNANAGPQIQLNAAVLVTIAGAAAAAAAKRLRWPRERSQCARPHTSDNNNNNAIGNNNNNMTLLR